MFHFFKRNKKINTHTIDLDEVFMDSINVSGFNTQQFEGVIERSISKKTTTVLITFFILVGIIFIIQLTKLQLVNGQDYFTKSENNRLQHTPLFADRGVIFDRNGVELAWNVISETPKPFAVREYIPAPGFAHLIGYVGYPTKDKSGFFWQDEIVGKSGVEKRMNDFLAGINGQQIVEVNAYQDIVTENLLTPPVPGKNITLTIDSLIQKSMHAAIKELAETRGFEGGAGVMMNIHTGEVLALTSYPEYDLNILSHGEDRATIARYATDERRVYLHRAVSGLYTPGSIVKPFLALAALQEGVITPTTTVYSDGQVEIPNRYDPTQPQIFRDWRKEGHGTTNVYHAIADSVNTFFYAIGGGYKNQSALGIDRIDTYLEKFGLHEKTNIDIDGETSGVIPSIAWKAKTFPKDPTWRQGDTYNSSIGQFGFQVTTLEMVRAVAAIANRGKLVQPFVFLEPRSETPEPRMVTGIDDKWYTVIHDAMRQTVTKGTAQGINVPYVAAAAKTGTAQVGPRNAFMNSWTTGFFPVENPKYAFVVVMEKAASTNQTGATFVMNRVFNTLQTENPNFFIQ